MSNGLKYALVFTGGVAVGIGVCGAELISYALNDEDIREGIKNKISRKIDRTIYGERPRRNRSGYVHYRDVYRKADLADFSIIFDTRLEADKVKDQMNDIIDKYGFVTVSDMYSLSGLTDTSYRANKYGWANLRNVEIRQDRDGYIIDLPKPLPID